jgi:hypothetical protein
MLQNSINVQHRDQAPFHPSEEVRPTASPNVAPRLQSFGSCGSRVITFNHSWCGAAATPTGKHRARRHRLRHTRLRSNDRSFADLDVIHDTDLSR